MPAFQGKMNVEPPEAQVEHLIIRVERQRYIYFTCPSNSRLEIASFDVPVKCPICRQTKPVKMGTVEGEDSFAGYSHELGEEIVRLAEGD